MLSSLSSVPPVWPNPRPDIIGTVTPTAASSGARMSEVLSPTPPVECLSTHAGAPGGRCRDCPVASIAAVSALVSLGSNPRQKMAIRRAESW
jgi:hypothetical protein